MRVKIRDMGRGVWAIDILGKRGDRVMSTIDPFFTDGALKQLRDTIDKHLNPKQKYLTTLNWHGEIHEFYSTAKSPAKAKQNAIFQLTKKLDRRPGSITGYFNGQRDNFSVKEV